MKILHVASEAVPFCKTGGLADVIGALPKALRKARHDARIILPKYKSILTHDFALKDLDHSLLVPMEGFGKEVGQLKYALTDAGVPAYFIANNGFFSRPELYGTVDGDYPDNAERFIFFARAALEACKAVRFKPDIIHCHDWQTGLIPAYLKTVYRHDPFFRDTAAFFTVHNVAYQGTFPKEYAEVAGFDSGEFTPAGLEYFNALSFLKAGIVYADAISTVSPTYSFEIQSGAVFGRGMEGVLRHRHRDLFGILNGLDEQEWNPKKDAYLAKPFNLLSLEHRAACKADLQRRCGLPQDPSAPLFGVVSRVDPQKGIDLILQILPAMVAKGAQIVFLGRGERQLMESLEQMFESQRERFYYSSSFDESLAHRIYGGSDFFMMPSRYEPCGLSQMIAMRYGAIPLVSPTGGLMDTVTPFDPETLAGTGLRLKAITADALLSSVEAALRFYPQRALMNRWIKNAMDQSFSWAASVRSYLTCYRHAQYLAKHRKKEKVK